MNNSLRYVLGVYCIMVAAAVGLHFVGVTLYDDGSTGYPAWDVINWFSAVGILIALGASLSWKALTARSDAAARQRLGASALFYAALTLALLFFWNWASRGAGQDDFTVWAAVDALIVAVLGATGFRLLWHDADESA